MGETGTLAGCIDVLRAGFPTLQVDRCTLLGEGWDSVAVLVNGHLVFRFAKRSDAAVRQAREAALLTLLLNRLPLPVPRYLFAWSDPAWPGLRVVGYQVLRGQPLAAADALRPAPAPRVRRADRSRPHHATRRGRQAAELGAFLRALHAVPLEDARQHGALGGNASSRREAYRDFYAVVCADMLPLFTVPEQAAIRAFWTRYLEDDTCFAFTATLVHRDLIVEHVLHDPSTGQVTGVIDWGDAGIDDPAVDFAGLRRQLGDAFARRMLAAYAHGDQRDCALVSRMDFYAGMEPFHEIHFGQVHGDAAHLAHGVAWARQQIAPGRMA
jgi:aminoglycoside 2''-phosphotransferase